MRPIYVIVGLTLMIVILFVLIGMATGVLPTLNEFIAQVWETQIK